MKPERPILGPTVPEEVEEELHFHLAMRARDLMDEGMSEEQARAEALRRFGDLSNVRAACRRLGEERERDRRRVELLAELRQDLIFGWRQLRRSPGFTAIATITLALGIGATTAVFGIVDAVLLRPLPFPAAERLVAPQSHNLKTGESSTITYADYRDWRTAGVFADVAAYWEIHVNVGGGERPERLKAVQATDGFLSTLGVAPTLGRRLRPEEHLAGSPRRALISYRLWQSHFGGDRNVVGKSIRVTGVPVEVVGVVPQGLEFPAGTDLWLPLKIQPEDAADFARRSNYVFLGIARLRPDRTLQQTNAEMGVLAERAVREDPGARQGVTMIATPLARWLVGRTLPRTLWLLLGASALVLLIGCVNVTNLLLARAAARRRELGVRAALGAGRARLLRQLLAESLVLGGAGGLLGVAIAAAGTRALVAAAPADVPRLDSVQLNLPVLGFALLVALVATAVFSMAPAMRGAGESGGGLLAGVAGRATIGGRRRQRRLLVAAELALALLLLLGSTLLLRSLLELRRTDPGFAPHGMLTFALSTQGERYDAEGEVGRTFATLLERLDAVPGVRSAALLSSLPLGGGGFYLGRSFLTEGAPEPPAGPDQQAQWDVVSPGTFATLGVPLVGGRDFGPEDTASSPPVAIVNREFVRQMAEKFGKGDPLGRRIRSHRDENVYREIVGVVGDVRFFGADDELQPVVYVPHAQSAWGSMMVALRTEGDPAAVLPAVRQAVASVDPELPLDEVQTMDAVFARSVAPRRFVAGLIGGFAAMAVLLALVGVYGVLAYEVGQRRREIGVRMALGSRRGAVVGLVVREAAALVVAGVAVGLVAGLLLSGQLAPLLYETRAKDPATFALVPIALAAVALLAAWVPARRASRVEPIVALRLDG
ncbi:MAG TPA: ABC transporter permease [Thermoanaerobaculia bacterium]|jgi:predicted permease|nr:ABC transporter permease [Thermoanaerobaculia bacterium]